MTLTRNPAPAPWVLLTCACLAVTGCHGRRHAVDPHARGSVVDVLSEARHGVHAYGRRGDLVLHTNAPQAAQLTVAAAADLPGHRPLRGAVLDVTPVPGDAPDPLLWWRPVWLDADWHAHPMVATQVTPSPCGIGWGVRSVGTVDGVTLSMDVCTVGEGTYRAVTHAMNLPAGARLGEEIVPGTSDVLVQDHGIQWEDEVPSRWMVLADQGTTLVFGGTPFTARRRLVHIAAEAFPAPVLLAVAGADSVRTLQVNTGDTLDGLSRAATGPGVRRVSVHPPDGRGGSVDLLDAAGVLLASGGLSTGPRTLSVPAGTGTSLRVRNADGVADQPVLLPVGQDALRPVALPAHAVSTGTLRIAATDPDGTGVPVHVMVRGLDGASDPVFRSLRAGAGHVSGRSAYLVDGHGTLGVAPGQYQVTVSRGPGWTLLSARVQVSPDGVTDLAGSLRSVTPPGWIAADLHLHAAPSPDARVSLAERVASLACNGVELAVATDHNRITDYGPTVTAQGLDRWLTPVAGDEVTSGGAALWGHFNAFPLPLPPPTVAPEDAVPAYWNVEPAALFRAARMAGASVVQVNHPRMPPSIGYFDLTHLDPRTGSADGLFDGAFNAVEAFNGIWLESPDRVRQGAVDLVGLARRGLRVAATGNSDSHRLVYEEAGYPRTWIRLGDTPAQTVTERTLAGLRSGATVASSGPFVDLGVQGRTASGPGGTVRPAPDGTVRVSVRVIAPAWVPVERVEIWLDGVAVRTLPVTLPAVDGERFHAEVTVPVTHDALLGVWVDAQAPLPDVLPYTHARAIGFTTPIGVDVDGDGRVVPPPGPLRAVAPSGG